MSPRTAAQLAMREAGWPAKTLTIYQIKEDVPDPNDIVKGRESLRAEVVRITEGSSGLLYILKPRPKEPAWVKFFEPFVDTAALRIRSALSGAVLLMKGGKRHYALTFGIGHILLDDEFVERRFGLRVTLNAVSPDHIRSIDHRRLDAVPRMTREQLSKASRIHDFGLDVERDMLKALTGKPEDDEFADRLTGGDQLSVAKRTTLRELPALLESYGTLAEGSKYKESFAWVDNVFEVRDQVLVRRLDDMLVKAIRARDAGVWLAPPDIIDWSRIEGFKYRGSKSSPVWADLTFTDYLKHGRRPSEVTPEVLRADKIRAVSVEDGSEREQWSTYRCIVAELNVDGTTYILSEGKRYDVEPSFYSAIEEAVKAVPTSTIKLPDYKDRGEKEYNERVARRSNGRIALLDRNEVRLRGRGKVEACDLYTADKQFVHVKRGAVSSVLSHLFSQGLVSSQLFLYEAEYRQCVCGKLPAALQWERPGDPIRSADYEVVYAIVLPAGKELQLPFFSRITLRNTTRLLQQMGFKYSLAAIASR